MSLVGEIGTSVVTLRGLADFTRENQVSIFSKVFQGVLVIFDSILGFHTIGAKLLKLEDIKLHQKVCPLTSTL